MRISAVQQKNITRVVCKKAFDAKRRGRNKKQVKLHYK